MSFPSKHFGYLRWPIFLLRHRGALRSRSATDALQDGDLGIWRGWMKNSKAFQPRFLHSLKWIWIMEKIAGEVYGNQMQWCWQRFNKLMKPLFFSLAIYSASVKFLESARQLMPSSGLPWSSSSLERKFSLLIQVDLKRGEESGRNPIKSEVSGQWNSVCMEDNFPVKVRHVIDIRFFKWT